MQVTIGKSPIPRLHSRKSLWLLALLTLRHGRPVEREWLAETLWPDAEPGKAMAGLRSIVSDLRKALGSEGERLQSPNRHALQMDLAGANVDVITFDATIKSSDLFTLEMAVALYQGTLLEGCAEEWVGQERVEREQNCIQALQTLAESALAERDYSMAARCFQQAIRLDPWRDASQRGLMQSLSASGNTNAALDVYQAFVRLLRSDDPRAAPDEETTALYTHLRAAARQRASAQTMTTRPEAASPAVTGYLPHALTDLTGREDECLEAATQLRRSRLVTLTGPGGIGKTRLALEIAERVAHEYADGVWLVALEALMDGARLPGQVAAVMGLKEETDRTFRESLTDHLKPKRLLLVLDNCEHVLEESAQVASHLLRECAGLRILATSRQALGITGETSWAVPPLTVPDLSHLPEGQATLLHVLASFESIQLFVKRAQAVQKAFALRGENALLVAQICACLEGIPLAIELAAARVKTMTVAQIASRLGDHLCLLAGGNRRAPSRQQTLRATLDWSYALLSPAERLLLERLSVFAGGWDIEAAEQVGTDDGIEVGRILDLLASLVDKSLVVFEVREKGLIGRYRMLETVRQYAAERLEIRGETERVKLKHRDWILALATEADAHHVGADKTIWRRRLETEYDNLCATLDWGIARASLAQSNLKLTGLLHLLWEDRGDYRQGRDYLTRALAQDNPAVPTAERAKALNGAGTLAFRQGYYAAARQFHEEGLRLRRLLGLTDGIATSLSNLANVMIMQGEYEMAMGLLEESLKLRRELGNKRGIAYSLEGLGIVNSQQGNYAAANVYLSEGLTIRREMGDTLGTAQCLSNLGNVFLALGEYPAAQDRYEECASLFRELGVKYGIAWSLNALGGVVSLRGNQAWAQELHEESLALYREVGERQGIAESLSYLGRAASWRGQSALAQELYQESLTLYSQVGYRQGIENILREFASALLRTERRAAIEKAVRLWGSASSLRERFDIPLPPNQQASYALELSQARAIMGEAAFADAWEGDQSLSWEQAVAKALENPVKEHYIEAALGTSQAPCGTDLTERVNS